MKRYWVIPACILLLFFSFTVLASALFSLPSGSIEGISDGVTLAPARRNLLSELKLVSVLAVLRVFTFYPFEFIAGFVSF